MPFDAVFNAKDFEPQQSGSKHAVGNKWEGTITGTRIDPTKDGTGGMFVVTFTSAGGSVDVRYNLWNESEPARNIAKKQLSALCHAVGIFQLDFKNDAANLRGAKLRYDVNFQAGQEPSAEKPTGGYVEVKHIYDMNGNDNWGSGAAPSQQQQSFNQQPQPNNMAGGNGWNQQPQQQQQQQQPQVQQGWNNGGQQQQSNQMPNEGGWQQGAGQANPPWKA